MPRYAAFHLGMHCLQKYPSRSFQSTKGYNPFLVYCRELAPGTVSLTGDRAQGDDSKYDSHYTGFHP